MTDTIRFPSGFLKAADVNPSTLEHICDFHAAAIISGGPSLLPKSTQGSVDAVLCDAQDFGRFDKICGGGPHLSLWHLDQTKVTTIFDDENFISNHVTLFDGTVISGESGGNVEQWSVNGDKVARVPMSFSNVFHVNILDKHKVMTVVGNSHKIDVCKNFYYKSYSVSMF
ncbi:hypothetical protein HELRODRAFT_181165 [Helobdella robusta]|uniref:Uncharacterized protein n=1 Tax=Helobdella robusta TaxID=6412 RepID=T1FGP6_HELRO|nr:hypothetical protein HELRODRAFT_181165 [Helobdella robusta]ESN93231.1 hypothetical protein HELRODRAFT_181165 [Helobdella robusta]